MELPKSLLRDIGQYLSDFDETVSVAENITSGFLQFSFSQIPHASKVFKGGLTVYDKIQKENLLRVSSESLAEENIVSEKISLEMALKVAEVFETDWGIGITGSIHSSNISESKTLAHFSFSHKNKIIFSTILELHPRTVPINAQLYYAEFLLGCFKCELSKMISKLEVG